MITKRDKVQIILNQAEYVAFQKVTNILEDYINKCDKNDYIDLNGQIYEYVGVQNAIGYACDILQYICDNSIIEK